MFGKRIAVLGLGRSGLAVARAAAAQGAEVTVYDQKPEAELGAFVAQLDGIKFVGEWHGHFNPATTDTIVTSPGVDMRKGFLRAAEASGIEVIGEIEFAYRISKAPIIAITGTNGKSTTTLMTWLALKEAGQDAILCGNIFGSGYQEIPLTEAAINSTVNQVLVAEISSFQLEWIKEFRPKCAAITNISPDHLNRYDSFDQYAATKRKIFSFMGEGDTIVANLGDVSTYPGSMTSREARGLPRMRFYGAAGVDASFDGSSFKLAAITPISELPFSEKHNLQNAALASLLALSYLESKDDDRTNLEHIESIMNGLKKFRSLGHRMERVGEKDGIQIINNSMCTNPAAVVASSSSVGMPQHLLIGGIRKGLDFAPVKDYLKAGQHKVYLFGSDATEINEQLGGVYTVYKTMGEAFTAAAANAKTGDAILLAPGCASMDQFEDFRARGEEFKRIAKEWLQQ